jgi:hypothetical protein
MTNNMAPEFFIGRDQEFALVGQLLQEAHEARRLLLLNAPGGYGKTRLLYELYKQRERVAQAIQQPLLCFKPVDLDDVALRLLSSVIAYLAEQLEPSVCEAYYTEYGKYARLEQQGADTVVLQEHWRRSVDTFVTSYAQAVKDKLALIMLDTFEEAHGSELVTALWGFLERLPNTLVIVAGRQVDREEKPLVERWGQASIHRHDLAPFSLLEASDYLERAETGAGLDPEVKEKIYILTEGHPILVALAEYWLRRDMPLDHLVARPLDELRSLSGNDLKRKRKDFEAVLVNKILDLTEIDQALLRMAYLHRQFNDEILQVMLDLTPEQAGAISTELCLFPFVRPRPGGDYALHDEMRSLVIEHSWRTIDPHKLQRHLLARQIIDRYYVPHISDLDQQIKAIRVVEEDRKSLAAALNRSGSLGLRKWRLEADRLYYEMELDAPAGYAYFSQLFENALGSNNLSRCELLSNTLDEQKEKLEPFSPLLANLQIKRARWQWLSDEPKVRERAEQVLRRFAQQPRLDKQNKIEALSTVAGRTVDIQEAVRLRRQCVQLAKQLGDRANLARMYNYLGLAYRRAGDWDKAAEWYTKARRQAEVIKDKSIAAEAINHLAFIARLQGYTDKAEHLCGLAMSLRRAAGGRERDLARSYQTYGEIYSDMRLTHRALVYFEQTAEICRRLGAEQDLAMALGHIANIYRQQHRPKDVERYLDESIAIHEKGGNLSGLAAAYGEYGCEYRKRAWERYRKSEHREHFQTAESEFATAEKHFLKGRDCAQQSGNEYREADILIDLALLEFYRYKVKPDPAHRDKAEDYLALASKIAQNHNYVLWQGRIEELRGSFALVDGELEQAFLKHFARTCQLLVDYPSERFREAIERVQVRIRELGEDTSHTPQRIQLLLSKLIEIFRASGAKRFKDLIKECKAAQKYVSWRDSSHARA